VRASDSEPSAKAIALEPLLLPTDGGLAVATVPATTDLQEMDFAFVTLDLEELTAALCAQLDQMEHAVD
jgi:hypothetical protein